MRAPPAPRALGHAAAAVRPFRSRGRVMLAVIVKATFQLDHKRAMSPLPPAPIVAADVRAGRAAADPRAAISAASEMAPFLPRADVLLGGHAWARGRSPAPLVPVRLRVGLDAAVLLDKALHVYGDRGGNGRGAPQPFLAMPLGYERAPGGAADPDNPAGVDPRAGRAPNIIDPRQPARAAGFGPIAAHWPARQRRLGNADPRGVQAPWPVVPDGFDWAYFQAAPADQQAPYLRGNEWILIEGMHPDLDRIEAWLPGPVAEARVAFGGAAQPQALPLVADMLVIDADRWLCSLVWRASALLPGEEALASVRVTARVALPGEEVPWDLAAAQLVRAERAQAALQPARAAQAPAAASPQRAGRGAAEHPLAGTVALDPEQASSAASPQRAGRGAAENPLAGTVALDPDEGQPSPALPFRSPAASAGGPRLERSRTADMPTAAGTPPAAPRRGGLPFVAPAAAGAASGALPFAPAAPSSPGARDGAAAWGLPFAAPAAASPAAPVRTSAAASGVLPFVSPAAASGVLPFVSPAAASGVLPFAPAPAAPVPAAPQSPSAHPPAPSAPPAPERSSPWVSGAAPHAASEPQSPWVSGAAAASAPVASPPPVAPSYALSQPRIAPSYALGSSPAASPWPVAAAAAPARRPARPRRQRLAPDARPSSEPLIPPRKRRPAKVAADGLGASFLRSVPDAAPTPT